MATWGSAKKKQGNKNNTATNMVGIKMRMAHTANILPARNCIVDIFFAESLMF
jgi:hypothetical protein